MEGEVFDGNDDGKDDCLELEPEEYKRYLEIVAVRKAVERIGVSALKKRFDDKRTRKETLSELKKFVDENNLNFEAALATFHLRNSRVQTATLNHYRKDLTRDGKPESD